ncbi:T3SS (YopN, CesT) and YbjN peptide-binding chaperone 1 [Ralstonia sp. 24A2]|uniref:T3SS (YopN, CesT) and YbjN peptide-binding chaperone 1 n=1 Tax=Ralstonia sp. 24A2 TaxID=3447364 RepID=UPI003F69FA26
MPWQADRITAPGTRSFTLEETMHDHVKHLLDHLLADGYPAERDDDGDIRFKREGMTYALCFDEDDPDFAKLILPNVWRIDSEPELRQALAALDQVNRRMKLVKAHTQAGAVWFTVELLFDDQCAWERHLSRAVRAIARAVMMFGDAMQDPRADDQAGTPLN